MFNLCIVKEGCFGCCGRHWKSEKKVLDTIQDNLEEYKKFPKTKKGKLEFRNRYKVFVRSSGICQNLIVLNNRYGCPLHPALNRGDDLRKDYCNIEYNCDTKTEFDTWNKKKQLKFIKFLENSEDNIYLHSLYLDSGYYLRKFKKNE